jgi:hypothetical protein
MSDDTDKFHDEAPQGDRFIELSIVVANERN